MNWVKTTGAFFAASAMVGVPLATSVAQNIRQAWISGYVAPHPVGSQHCPGLAWQINRVELPNQSFNVSGPIWYGDGSGMSFAKGTRQADGKFALTVQRQSGDGPTGTITGQRKPDGSAEVTTTGSPCLAGTYHIAPEQTSTK